MQVPLERAVDAFSGTIRSGNSLSEQGCEPDDLQALDKRTLTSGLHAPDTFGYAADFPDSNRVSDAPITHLLDAAARGDRAADEALVAAVVGQLERIARNQLAAGNRGGLDGLTLEPQMIAHDALLKLFQQPVEFENRRHFFAYASQVMARAIIDYQRKRGARKRGGDFQRVTLSGVRADAQVDLFDVPEALAELQEVDPRKAELVGLRVFWGATMEEAAELLEISLSTAERDWRFARRWLAERLTDPVSDPDSD